MTSNDYNLLATLIRMPNQHQVKRLVTQVLVNLYKKDSVEETPHYTYVCGDMPIMLCAHCDTVCTAPVEQITAMADPDKNYVGLTNKDQAPLGADDRVGIFIILKLTAMGYRPHILLTTDEEIGGLGAMAAADNIFSPDVKFILELDRMGSTDAAMYDCDNKQFMEMLQEYGFTPVSGTFSDICLFAPEWDIAAANLSVGYYHEHTPWEIVYPYEIQWTINRVAKILDNCEKFSYYNFEPKKYDKFASYDAMLRYNINLAITGSKSSGKKKNKKH